LSQSLINELREKVPELEKENLKLKAQVDKNVLEMKEAECGERATLEFFLSQTKRPLDILRNN